MKVADQIWVAVASLQKELGEAKGFTKREIEDRVRNQFGSVGPAVMSHLYLHCVANSIPNPGRYRMLYRIDAARPAWWGLAETAAPYRAGGPARWRLFRPGDDYAPEREGGKMHPEDKDLPEQYKTLLRWYREEYASPVLLFSEDSPLLRLAGIGNSRKLDVSEKHDQYLADVLMRESQR